jgi:hypothetical protein
MNLEIKATTTDKKGRTRIQCEIVIDPSYAPGAARAAEAGLQAQFNTLSAISMGHFLKTFDTCGETIHRDGVEYYSKGLSPETYQAAGGPVVVERYVYQSAKGGRTIVPLEERARIIANTTPHFADIASGMYARISGREAKKQIQATLQRDISLETLQRIADTVGKVALAQERGHPYAIRSSPDDVAAIVVQADATTANMVGEGFKHVALGGIFLLDAEGARLEEIFIANAPEEGKTTFWARLERELDRVKEHFPDVPCFGLSDGAEEIQNWLEKHCDGVGLDFYHVTEYVGAVKGALGPDAKSQSRTLARELHELKHTEGAAEALLEKLRGKLRRNAKPELAEKLADAIRYIERNRDRMEYAYIREQNLPIGSGWIEAGCKCVVKLRSGLSGARWKRRGLQHTLALRSLCWSGDRWEQLWKRCMNFGY